MQRRSVIKLLVSLTAACSSVSTLQAALRSEALPLESSLLSIFPSPASAKAVGKAYLHSLGMAADHQALKQQWIQQDALFEHIEIRSPLPVLRQSLRQSLSLRIKQDFEAGRTVSVQGWVLSETEARVCAMTCIQGS
jgi:hypothetical protein